MGLLEHYISTDGDTTDTQGTYDAAVSTSAPCSLTVAMKYAVPSDRINIKSGTYTRTAADAFAHAPTVGGPIILRGVDSSWNPIVPTRNATTGVLSAVSLPVIAYSGDGKYLNIGTYGLADSLSISGSNGNNNGNIAGGCCVNCVITGSSQASVRGSKLVNCDIATIAGGAFCCYGCKAYYCRITPAAGDTGMLGNSAFGCLFIGGAYGIDDGDATMLEVVGCTFYGQTTAAIREYNGSRTTLYVYANNSITDCAQAFVNPYGGTEAHAAVRSFNRTRDNTAADSGYGDWPIMNGITTDAGGAETDYVNAGGGDFHLIPSSPANGAGPFPKICCGALQGPFGVWPAVGKVSDTLVTAFGPTGTEFYGTRTDADKADVKAGVKYGDPDDQLTGELVAGGGVRRGGAMRGA